MVKFTNIKPEEDNTTPLEEIFKLRIKSLDEALGKRKRPKTKKRYFAIQQRIVEQGLARDLPTYLLYRYQFDDMNIPRLADELGVSFHTLSRLMRDMNIPIKTSRDWRRDTQASDATRIRMSQSHKGIVPEEYAPREVEIISSCVGSDLNRRFPAGTYRTIQQALVKEGFDRTVNSLRSQVNRMRHPENNNNGYEKRKPLMEFNRVKGTTRKHLVQIIDNEIKSLPVDEDTEALLDNGEYGDSRKSRHEKRKHWLKYATPGHMKLLIFLSDPENYEKYIEKGIRRVATDFQIGKDDCAETKKLFERFQRKVLSLEDCTAEDLELSKPGWMRCDMIFRRKNGEYLIVEVKQYARNRGRNRNGDRTLEQLHGYVGGLTARIVTYNFRKSKRKSDFVDVPRFVHGYVAAYEIQQDLKDVSRTLALNCVEVPQDIVNEYIEERLDEQAEEEKRKSEQTYPVPAVVNESFAETILRQYSNLPYIDFFSTNGNNHQDTLLLGYEPVRNCDSGLDERSFVPVNAVPVNGNGSNGNGRTNKNAFRAALHLIEHAQVIPVGTPIGAYDSRTKCLYVGDRTYNLNASRKRIQKVERLVQQGKIKKV